MNSYRSFLYLPAEPTPSQAPVILYLHGYFDATPEPYDAMLRHYARSGYIVIYASYGNPLYAKAWPDNAREAYSRALRYIAEHSPIKADHGNVAFLGHSIGGILAFHLADKIGEGSPASPKPKLIVTTDAAGIATIAYPHVSIDHLDRIPSDTSLLLLVAEESYEARLKESDRCGNDAKEPARSCNGFAANLRVMKRTPQIPASQKISLLMSGDSQGATELISDHNGAQGICGDPDRPINALDTWGYWRNTLKALDAVLKNQGDFTALRSPQDFERGRWSNGEPMRSPRSLDDCFAKGQCPPARGEPGESSKNESFGP